MTRASATSHTPRSLTRTRAPTSSASTASRSRSTVLRRSLAVSLLDRGLRHWPSGLLAQHLGIGDATVARAWRAYACSHTFPFPPTTSTSGWPDTPGRGHGGIERVAGAGMLIRINLGGGLVIETITEDAAWDGGASPKFPVRQLSDHTPIGAPTRTVVRDRDARSRE